MRARRTTVAGIDTVALRVSFTGDLGWELHVEEDQQLALFDALMDAGADLDVRPVGSRALLSMRVEKGYGSWGREYSPPEYWPQEVGLERLIKLDKPEFLGPRGLLQAKKTVHRVKKWSCLRLMPPPLTPPAGSRFLIRQVLLWGGSARHVWVYRRPFAGYRLHRGRQGRPRRNFRCCHSWPASRRSCTT